MDKFTFLVIWSSIFCLIWAVIFKADFVQVFMMFGVWWVLSEVIDITKNNEK